MMAGWERALTARLVSSQQESAVLRIATFAVGAGLVTLVAVVTFSRRWPGIPDASVELAALLGASCLLLLRVPRDRLLPARSRYAFLLPYALAAIAILCGIASAIHTGSLFILIAVVLTLAAGADTDATVGLLITLAGILATIIAGLAFQSGAAVTVGYPIVLALGMVLGSNLRANQISAEKSQRLLVQAEQLRGEQARVAALDERTRIAREIHDVLAHSLAALGLQIQVARAVLADRHDVEQAIQLLDQAQTIAADGVNETRRAVHALRGGTTPLPDALTDLGMIHQRRHRALVTIEVEGEPQPTAPDAHLAILRAAQEALVNGAKHAPHQPIAIRLFYGNSSVALSVTNPTGSGRPTDAPSGFGTVNGGYGLAGIRERILLLDGTLTTERNGSAWVLNATIPV